MSPRQDYIVPRAAGCHDSVMSSILSPLLVTCKLVTGFPTPPSTISRARDWHVTPISALLPAVLEVVWLCGY